MDAAAIHMATLQAQAAIHAQPTLAEAVSEWRKCWYEQEHTILDAEEVYEKFHVLLRLTTTMRVPPLRRIDRQPTDFGRYKSWNLLPVNEGFDKRISVSVKLEESADEDTLQDIIDGGEETMTRVTRDTTTEIIDVYVQCQKPSVPVQTTEFHREQMHAAVFNDFRVDLDTVINECQVGQMLFENYAPSNDGVRLLKLFEVVIAALAEMQEIRPCLINLSGEYVNECFEDQTLFDKVIGYKIPILAEVPEEIRAMASHAIYMRIDSAYMSAFPEWIGEFTSLKVLHLTGSSRERTNEPHRFTRYSNKAMQTLPDFIWQMSGLEHLELAHFMSIEHLPDSMANMTSLMSLALRNMFDLNKNSIPGSIQTLPALARMDLTEMRNVTMDFFLREPRAPITTLKDLRIYDCDYLTALPDDFAMFPSLEYMELIEIQCIRTLPSSVSCLKKLKSLELNHLENFGAFSDDEDEDSDNDNDNVSVHGDNTAEAELAQIHDGIADDNNDSNDDSNDDDNDSNDDNNDDNDDDNSDSYSDSYSGGSSWTRTKVELEDKFHTIFRDLDSLESLHLYELEEMKFLPRSIHELTSLKGLTLESMPAQLPAWITRLSNLETLCIESMENIHILPDTMHEMHALKTLRVANIDIVQLPHTLYIMSRLEILDLKCIQLTSIPSAATGLVALKQLIVVDCPRLQSLPENLNELAFLGQLKIRNCPRMSAMPETLSHMTQLHSLEISSNVACLSNNSATMHGIGGLRNLTYLNFGPWEGNNFPVCMQNLVKMEQFIVQVKSDGVLGLHDPTVFKKIAWIVACMPELAEFKLAHGRYAPAQAVLFPLAPEEDMSLSLVSLRAYPRLSLKTFDLYGSRVLTEGATDQIKYKSMSTMHPICLYMQQLYGCPDYLVTGTNPDFLADWCLSLEKVLAFMQAMHPRLGANAGHVGILSNELCQQISHYFLHRPEFENVVRGIANL